MGEQLPIGRSPRAWREPRTRDDWIAVLAWAQLGAVLVFAALLALLAWAFADFDSIACFDADDPGCPRPVRDDASWFGAPELIASVVLVTAAFAAVLVARRHLRGGASRPAALIAVALPLPLAILAGALTGVPF